LGSLLFGVGLLYLGTGSFAFPTVAVLGTNPLALAGVVLVALGLPFEMAVFPFHWGGLDA
jgi:NADH:ubiquinone oxidoreductase subunit 2 (subunit N)